MDASDAARRSRADLLNSLESFTYRARDLLDEDGFVAAATDAARTGLETELAAAADWITEAGNTAPADALQARLTGLHALVDPVLARRDDAARRPAAVKALEDALVQMDSIVGTVRAHLAQAASASASASSSGSDDDLEDQAMLGDEPADPSPFAALYTDADVATLTDTADAARAWLAEKLAAQAALGPADRPALTARDLEAKAREVNTALKELLQRQVRMATEKPKAKGKKPRPQSATGAGKGSAGSARPTLGSDEEKRLRDLLAQRGVDMKLSDLTGADDVRARVEAESTVPEDRRIKDEL